MTAKKILMKKTFFIKIWHTTMWKTNL